MTNCLIKNLLPNVKEPKGNTGLGFPWEMPCPKPENILGYYCPLLDEEDAEPLLLNDGQPILIECVGLVTGGPSITPPSVLEENKIIVTAYYSSCPTRIEYSVAASFNVDDDIQLCFENEIGLKSSAPMLTGVCITINKDTAIGYVELTAMKLFLELDGISTFKNIFVTPFTVSSFSYPVEIYPVFEIPGCYLAIESGTPGFTVDDSILCNDGVLLEESTTGIAEFNIDITCA